MHVKPSIMMLAISLLTAPAAAQVQCETLEQRLFPGTDEREQVRRARRPGAEPFGVFRAPLVVNTDGAPTSYHPDDPLGERLAINKLEHSIFIHRAGRRLRDQAFVDAFSAWRQSGFPGFRRAQRGGPCDGAAHSRFRDMTICWTSVIASNADGTPCIFSRGEHAGYFGSLTAANNGLRPSQAGECAVRNQVDQRVVPALTLRGGARNPMHQFGVRKYDLAFAINPNPRGGGQPVVVAAMVADAGNDRRIGEGGVALNMRLRQVAEQPTTYRRALRLDTRPDAMVVAMFPGSREFQAVRPFTAQNLEDRLTAWARQKGYGSLESLAAAVLQCSEGL